MTTSIHDWCNPRPVLRGRLVRLEPLSAVHAADLGSAAGEDRTHYGWTGVPRPEAIDAYVAAQLDYLDRDERLAFAQISLRDGRAVGCTSFLEPRGLPETGELYALEIGATWLAASAMGTGVNTEAKLLLLRHAFESFGVQRVDLKTDARNERSRRAVAALGATFEGVLRKWSPSRAPGEEGELRDSAMYSITAAEWPDVEDVLAARVGRSAGDRR